MTDSECSPVVLFLARNFPPQVGGDEKYNYELSDRLKDHFQLYVVANKLGNILIPFFLFEIVIKTPVFVWKHDIDVIVLSDATLAPLGAVFRRLFDVSVIVKVNGLDVTYDNWLFQFIVPTATADADAVLVVSERTKRACVSRGVPAEKIQIIPPGISSDEFYDPTDSREELIQTLSDEYDVAVSEDQTVLLSVGRAVERKGFHWFAEQVVPRLDEEYVYVVAGEGPYRDVTARAAAEADVADRVFTLGYVPDSILGTLYNASDLFVMPNVPVEGDIEGFGLVTAEAGACGTPTVASDREGIKDAVIDGETGKLVQQQPEQFARQVRSVNFDPESVRQRIVESFSWEAVTEEYVRSIESVYVR